MVLCHSTTQDHGGRFPSLCSASPFTAFMRGACNKRNGALSKHRNVTGARRFSLLFIPCFVFDLTRIGVLPSIQVSCKQKETRKHILGWGFTDWATTVYSVKCGDISYRFKKTNYTIIAFTKWKFFDGRIDSLYSFFD